MAKKSPLTFQKTRTGLLPADPHTAARFEDMALGAEFHATPLTKRSNRQLGLYWSVLREVVDATERWSTPQHLHEILKMELGFRALVEKLDGEKRWVPDSVSFDAMTPEEFKEYFDIAIKALSEATGMDVLQNYYKMTGQAA